MKSIFRPNDLVADLSSIRRQASRRKGVSTGFETLDDLMMLDRGYLMVVTGHPSSGKSEFLDAILMNCAILHGWRTLYYSPENYPLAEHLKKQVERYAGKSLFDMVPEEIRSAVAFCDRHFAWMYPEEDYTLEGLVKLARDCYDEEPYQVLVIDPWNEVDHSPQGGRRDDQYIGACLSTLRRFQREKNILTCVVAHPVKPPQDARDASGNYRAPTLYDIAGGYTWRAKADYGWAAHRNPTENVMKFILQKLKYKNMGRLGTVSFDYAWQSGRFKGLNEREFLLPSEIESAF